MDRERFRIRANGGAPKNMQDNIRLGNYVILLEDCPLFNGTKETNESSHALFKNVFPSGFAWELLDLLSGMFY